MSQLQDYTFVCTNHARDRFNERLLPVDDYPHDTIESLLEVCTPLPLSSHVVADVRRTHSEYSDRIAASQIVVFEGNHSEVVICERVKNTFFRVITCYHHSSDVATTLELKSRNYQKRQSGKLRSTYTHCQPMFDRPQRSPSKWEAKHSRNRKRSRKRR